MTGVGRRPLLGSPFALALLASPALAQGRRREPPRDEAWAAAWAASAHGPYPSGNPQRPAGTGLCLPDPGGGRARPDHAHDDPPGFLGPAARLRFSNAFGTRPLVIQGVQVGLQGVGGNVARGTARR